MRQRTSRASVLVPLSALIISIAGWLGTGQKDWKLWLLYLGPLLLTTPGIARGHRYTHAWASLLTIIYLVVGMTEVIANPTTRALTGLITATALWFFVALIIYIRRTNPNHLDERS